MTDELVMDDDQADEDEGNDPVVAATRRARETLARVTMTPEQQAEHEERCRRNRLAEGDALFASVSQRKAQRETREAPLSRHVLHPDDPVVSLPALPRAPTKKPFTTDEVIAAVGLRLGEVRRDVARLEKREAGLPYREALEQAIGKLHGQLLKRHDEAEGRVTSTEARLAALEARIAVLEAKGVTEPEKQTGP